MNTYRVDGRGLVRTGTERAGVGPVTAVLQRPPGAVSVDAARRARSRIDRVTPPRPPPGSPPAALLVDIRPAAQRYREGWVAGALVVERNVLEWRFDPHCDARLPEATGYDVDVVVLCSEGYTSSLAADALRSLGLATATDVVGGFPAWVAAGLPHVPGHGGRPV